MVTPLRLFQAFGVELEYMIVDAKTLEIRSICDLLFERAGAPESSDVNRGPIAWSNELVMHVVELKTDGPTESLDSLTPLFSSNIQEINNLLAEEGAFLLPTAMHPWMQPGEGRIWPHEYTAVYQAYDRIFDCRGHGWSNLQSTHLNLPFDGDEEFGRLHSAIRLVLPLIPALAASSPFVEGTTNGTLDRRLQYYKTNQQKVPSIIGKVIPESVYTESEYQEKILQKTYRDIAPHDPDGVLQQEFLNSRGAIARFSRGSIEIRLMDIQESPEADLAILRFLVAIIRELCDRPDLLVLAAEQSTEGLSAMLERTIVVGERARDFPAGYQECFGLPAVGDVAELLGQLYERQIKRGALALSPILEEILERGPLSRRLLARPHASRTALEEIYRELADCLESNRIFLP